ncbi:4Fe-4S ferredoxin N-terminal domain-containing protein [Halopiger xanaduensis]|uniref:4Fe-4S ferredoxin iron-sulfur binding domain-containing protein n=1 Tax=Halopiger xanaduensis (strain DSM 18323 / JCM 14033 / SH-6) TaxID=797210 RepID=F8DAC6_HALXS|nr:4Fe-4S ferredoxin N-terminal domain-containing protein [Halopiger xanaduensis]AEH37887.1 4Fe-4S ferredoxin iron-sulfur binding domain-containing protein [Halopiger xanaduensis SH-6]
MSTDDESFHPLGSEWEDELEEMLDDTEYDTELGMKMAQDAMRVTKGELSEAEFHEKYHEDVMEEFGEDNRPTAEAFEAAQEEAKGTVGRMLDKFSGDGEDTRRGAMKKMGAGAAAVGLGAWGTAEAGQQNIAEAGDEGGHGGGHTEAQDIHERDTQWGMTIDLERCDGCLSCMTACASENDLDQGVNWMYVMAFEDELTAGGSPAPDVMGGVEQNMLVRPCQHCTDAPCEKVCPTTARHTRDKDGLVLTDYDVCIGCRYCQVACPYGVNYFQWDEPDVAHEEITGHGGAEVDDPKEITHAEYENGEDRWVDSRSPRGTMSKCTMCPSMQDGQQGEEYVGTTACERACPPNAIQFGNVKSERSDAYQHREHPSKSRAIIDISFSVPSTDEIDEALSDDDDFESALEALEIDSDLVSVMKAIDIVSERLGPGDEENNSILETEQSILESLDALEEYVDLESEEVLSELRLGDGEEDDAASRLREYAGNPSNKFKLLEDIGTNPNITYIGQEPGPEAHQVDGPNSYGDVTYTRSDGSEVAMVDNRKEDVLDEGTVGDAGVSL